MNIAITLLQVFVWALIGASLAGCAVVAVERWLKWQEERERLPAPPLSNDERIRHYEMNARAYKSMRG